MTPAGMGDVMSRVAEIRQRFAVPAGFDAALTGAGRTEAGAPTTASSMAAYTPPSPYEPAAANVAGTGTAAGQVPAGDWAARLPEAGKRWSGAIEAAARKHGVEPELLAALVRAESGFNPAARSHAGAIGLAQLMPGTARGLGVDPHDPIANLEGGAKYLRQQLDRFGSRELALAAYNAGPTRVARAGGVPNIAETQTYVGRVIGFYQELKS